MTDADDIGRDLAAALREREAARERELERLMRRAGWGKAAIVGALGVASWLVSLGRAEAEYVKRPELVRASVELADKLETMRSEQRSLSERLTRLEERVGQTKDDTAWIRSRLDQLGLKVRGAP